MTSQQQLKLQKKDKWTLATVHIPLPPSWGTPEEGYTIPRGPAALV